MFEKILRSPDDGAGGGGDDEGNSNEEPKGDGEEQPKGDGDGKPSEVRMSQEALNRLIDKRYAKAAETVERKILGRFGVETLDELEERVKGGGKAAKGGDDEAIRDALESARQEFGQERERLEKTNAKLLGQLDRVGVQSAVVAEASKAGAHDPEDVLRALQGRLKFDLEAGRVVVLTKAGHPAYGTDGEPLTVGDLVAECVSAKPHLFRVSTRGGANEKSGEAARGKKTLTRSQFDSLDLMERETKIREGFQIVDG